MSTKTIFLGKIVDVDSVNNKILYHIMNENISNSNRYNFHYSDEKYDVHMDHSDHSDYYRDHSDYSQHSDII
jgi:c-di-AMP phosphodiesterase-like protein